MITAVIVAWAAVLHTPAALAFPYHKNVGTTAIWSETPIDTKMTRVMQQADSLLAASPIDAPLAREIYLTRGGWRWSVLAATQRDAFAFSRPFSRAIVVNRSDIARDRVWNGAAIAGQRKLSGVIAHETVHLLLALRYGEIVSRMAPAWKQEGYADYVADESSLSDADAAQARVRNRNLPALLYYDGRRRVTRVLAANGGSVDALFNR